VLLRNCDTIYALAAITFFNFSGRIGVCFGIDAGFLEQQLIIFIYINKLKSAKEKP